MITIDRCPICSGTAFQHLYGCEDHTVSHETFQIKICSNCTLGITAPRPDTENIDRYYLSDEYISHSGKAPGIVGNLYRTARKLTVTWKQKLVESFTPNTNNILDFGCGTGAFLSAMKAKGWTISGIEPSPIARSKAENTLGISIHPSLHGLTQKEFSAITLWHVLEHVPDLDDTLTGFNALLEKGGALFVAVPNYQSPDAMRYKQFWAGFDVPRHLWHFSKQSMKQLLNKNGFTLEAIRPMMLDAFYISLLSEKYRGSPVPVQYFNGFVNGLSSNVRARRNQNFSSLIYIARSK
jgi:ubiquinone/menaquinone biosynthesis C-methylase UbiE